MSNLLKVAMIDIILSLYRRDWSGAGSQASWGSTARPSGVPGTPT